ncbi:MAG: type II toxin-antitoxin system VapC family toxin [Gammaproteobacteria bacterium]|nr:type II toxin-antitoxin system VapC family toxin [Gammaproteobacteria bacterium]
MIVLDTHVLIWALSNSPRLGAKAQARIDEERRGQRVRISAATLWEIALLVSKRRLELTTNVRDWIDTALAWPGVELWPIDAAIAVDSVLLPGDVHNDPADRFLIATARHRSATLVTADTKILSYSKDGHVRALNATQ